MLAALGQAREPGARRAAARALSRIATPAALERLLALLADEDPDIVRRAAYALGEACKGKADVYVPALVARATSLHAELARAAKKVPSAGADAPRRTAPPQEKSATSPAAPGETQTAASSVPAKSSSSSDSAKPSKPKASNDSAKSDTSSAPAKPSASNAPAKLGVSSDSAKPAKPKASNDSAKSGAPGDSAKSAVWAPLTSTDDGAAPLITTDDSAPLVTKSAAVAEPQNNERRAALRAVSGALGRCASPEAENVLRAWLQGPPSLADNGGYGLGQLAAAQGKLEDRSLVALLDAAEKLDGEELLFAFTRLSKLSSALEARLLEVAGNRLTEPPSTRRSLAVRALGAAGFAAAAPLGRVLTSAGFSSEERAAAAFALGRLGRAGQEELTRALDEYVRRPERWQTNRGEMVPLSAALAALTNTTLAHEALTALARLALPEEAPAWQKRRLVRLRCAAAALLAAERPGPLPAALLACDPEHGAVGALAVLTALDKNKIADAHLELFTRYVESPTPAVREAALRLLSGHPEIPEAAALLARALADSSPGVLTTAARVLSAYPKRAASGNVDVAPELELALAAVFERPELEHSLEALASSAEAIGALGLLSHKGAVERLCQSPHDEVRRHAARALGLLGDPKRTCERTSLLPDRADGTPPALALELTTDLGAEPLRIVLDAPDAPEAARRLSALARAGYYDGTTVHRVVEGFVAQLGDPVGDGFGDGKHPPLPDEKGPDPLEAGDVALATSGRDAAATQFFVTLARYPHLDGAYTRVGRAEGPWDQLAPGDSVTRVRVIER